MSFRPQPNEPLYKQVRALNLEEFVRDANASYSKNGFEEYAIGVDVQEFNGIASVFQSFYCKTLDGSYEARGVNAYQLVYLNNRWWIANTIYINETDDVKLPNDLLFEKYQTLLYRFIFYCHITSGLLAIILGPFQFIDKIIQQKKLHRFFGYCYVVFVVCSSILGLIIAQFAMGGVITRIGFSLLSIIVFQ